MSQFENVRIRAELLVDDVKPNNNFRAVATGRPPSMYRGAQVEFLFALFRKKGSGTSADPDELYDITNISGLPKLRIRTTNASGAVLLDETVATAVEKNTTGLTLEDWQNDNGWHFRFYFPATATGITAGEQYLVVYGADGDVFGRTQITVIEPGTGAAVSPEPGDELYYTKTDVNGKLNDKLDKQFADGQGLTFVAVDASGNRCRITLAPTWDEQGVRLVPIVEPLT
jgi:hypothetical protein